MAAATLDDLTRNIEAMSMSSIVTDIATPPPPPPPLEIERWRTMSKTYGSHKRAGFFARQFSSDKTASDYFLPKSEERSRADATCHIDRFSRESSVASEKSESSLGSSTFSITSKSSTLSRLFSRKSARQSRSQYARSASIDSLRNETWLRRGKKHSWSTPATPDPAEYYGTWRRGNQKTAAPATPSLGQRIKHALGPEKNKVGKFNARITKPFSLCTFGRRTRGKMSIY